MSEDFGSDFITIVDDDGTEFELELLDTMDIKDRPLWLFSPPTWMRTTRTTVL